MAGRNTGNFGKTGAVDRSDGRDGDLNAKNILSDACLYDGLLPTSVRRTDAQVKRSDCVERQVQLRVFASVDEGESFTLVADGLPDVLCVRAAVVVGSDAGATAVEQSAASAPVPG